MSYKRGREIIINHTRIEWADATWNPIVGCNRNCQYCYAKPIFERYKPGEKYEDIHYYPERLIDPDMRNKKPKRIFVGSMADIMDNRINPEFLDEIFEIIEAHPQHTFIFMTKNNYAYGKLPSVPDNCWMGITIDGQEAMEVQLIRMENLINGPGKIKFVSFEPLLGEVANILKPGIDWIIIGGMSGPKAIGYGANRIHVLETLETAHALGIPVFIKKNLKWSQEIINKNKYLNFPGGMS